MEINAFVKLTIKDTKTGKTLNTRRFKSRSYVLAFLDGLYNHFAQATHDIKDTAGDIQSEAAFNWHFDAKTIATDDTYGIVVGTGNTAIAIADYALATQIAHGAGAGQLAHMVSQFTAPETIADKRRFLATREFINQSGGAITAEECGIYVQSGAPPYEYCVVRDLIAGGKLIPDTATLVVQYEIYVEV